MDKKDIYVIAKTRANRLANTLRGIGEDSLGDVGAIRLASMTQSKGGQL